MAWRLDRCGTLRPTDRDFHAAGGAFRHADARGLFIAGRSSYYNGVSSRSLRHPSPTDRDFHSVGGALRRSRCPRPTIAWRVPLVGRFIFPIVAAPFSTQTPAAGFAPRNAARTLPHSSPHAAHRRLISSYKFLLSPSLFPVAAPIALRSARSAIALRASGRFAPHSFPLHGGETPTGLFFHLQVLPVLAAPPAPLQASAPVALPRPPLGGRSPTTSAAQSPESRLCGGLSASIHPLHSPHRPCPKIIVLRSASL